MRLTRGALRSRRSFLKSAGVTAATLPFLRALPGYAQSSTSKLILGFNGNGRIRHLWGADDSSGSLMMRPNLAPLQPYAKNVTILDGIRNFGAPQIGGTHEGGTMSLFTGVGGALDPTATSVGFGSIDAIFMAAQSDTVRSDSFYQQTVAERNTSENAGPNNRVAFDTSGNRRDPHRSSWEAFDNYLDGAIKPAAGGDQPAPEVDKGDLARTKLFEALNGQLGELESRLCREDYYQMQAMREAVAQAGKSMQQAVACEVPELPSRPTGLEDWEPIWLPPSTTIDLESNSDWYYLRGRLATDLLVMALACGVTRAGVLQFDQGAGEAQAVGQPEHHHNTSHGVPQLSEFLVSYMGTKSSDPSLPERYLNGDPSETDQYAFYTIDYQDEPTPAMRERFAEVWERLSKWELFYADQFAYLLQQLEAFGLMQDTAVLWGSELDDGQHEHYNMPFVLASGENLPFARGKVVRYPRSFKQTDTRWLGTPQGEPRSHNDLLRTVLHGVGVDVPSVGTEAFNSGLLDLLLA